MNACGGGGGAGKAEKLGRVARGIPGGRGLVTALRLPPLERVAREGEGKQCSFTTGRPPLQGLAVSAERQRHPGVGCGGVEVSPCMHAQCPCPP